MSNRPLAREQAMVIVLQQELPVRVMNISRSGCLLQVARSLRVGTVGRLRVMFDDIEYADDVRVARSTTTTTNGTGTGCDAGVELLWVPGQRNHEIRRVCGESVAWLWHSLVARCR